MEIFADIAKLIAAPLPAEGEARADAARIGALLADLDGLNAATLAAVTATGKRRDALLLADAELAAIDAAAAEIDALTVTLERAAVARTLLSERQEAIAALMQEAAKYKELVE